MVRSHICLNVDSDVWDIAKRKYPGMLSNMFEEFLRSMINADIPELEKKEMDELESMLIEQEEEFTKLKIKIDSLKQEKKKKEEKIRAKNKEAVGKQEKMTEGIINAGILRKVGR